MLTKKSKTLYLWIHALEFNAEDYLNVEEIVEFNLHGKEQVLVNLT